MTPVASRMSVTQSILILALLAGPCYGQAQPIAESVAQISSKQDSSGAFATEKAPTFDPAMLFVKTLTAVAVFSLLLYLVLRMLRSTVYGQGGATLSSMGIKVVGSAALGPKKSLCLVQILGHMLVLGMSEGEISLLLDVPVAELSEEQRLSLETGSLSQTPSFKQALSKWLGK